MMERNPSFNYFPTDIDSSKSRKHQRDDDAKGDVEWEETPTAGAVKSCDILLFVAKTFKVDLTGEKAEPSGNNEDDDGIDWEDG
uniref:Uncharacterized protein n=1 Tax=Tanacetum cinerariifolium TaxID=118510 RepID=A0A6L2MLH7_TANCI|nr:hypothetical protein [Tanacetum cinerariifolium]